MHEDQYPRLDLLISATLEMYLGLQIQLHSNEVVSSDITHTHICDKNKS